MYYKDLNVYRWFELEFKQNKTKQTEKKSRGEGKKLRVSLSKKNEDLKVTQNNFSDNGRLFLVLLL